MTVARSTQPAPRALLQPPDEAHSSTKRSPDSALKLFRRYWLDRTTIKLVGAAMSLFDPRRLRFRLREFVEAFQEAMSQPRSLPGGELERFVF